MLTLFEYLRQRAFESVITGAQEALELLETQGYFDRPAARINDRLQGMKKDAAAAGTTALEFPHPQASEPPSQPTSDAAEAKPPRKRSTRKGSRE